MEDSTQQRSLKGDGVLAEGVHVWKTIVVTGSLEWGRIPDEVIQEYNVKENGRHRVTGRECVSW